MSVPSIVYRLSSIASSIRWGLLAWVPRKVRRPVVMVAAGVVLGVAVAGADLALVDVDDVTAVPALRRLILPPVYSGERVAGPGGRAHTGPLPRRLGPGQPILERATVGRGVRDHAVGG